MFSTPAWRNLPIFVTSTFRDMHAERDHLMQVVFPELEERLRKRRHYLEPIDLRWGVETASIPAEEEKELAVLRVCLDEIERSRPFQIVLLGDRYGWVPPERLTEPAVLAGVPTAQPSMSVTALEIEAGVFSSGAATQRCFVYCRAPLPYRQMCPEDAARYSDHWADNAPAARRLARLKTRLRRRLPERVRTYRVQWDATQQRLTGLEDFGCRVLEDLWSELAAWTDAFVGQEPQSWQDHQRIQVTDFFAHQMRRFVGRKSTLGRLKNFALGQQPDGTWGLCLTGPSGSGKSSLLAKLHAALVAEEVLVLTHAPGAAEQGASVNAFLRRWIEELGRFLGEGEESLEDVPPSRLDEIFADRLERATQRVRVIVLLDALDQLEPTDRGRFLGWLPRLWPDNARFIATAVATDATWALDGRERCRLERITDLTRKDAVEIATTICRHYHRDLNPEVRSTLLARADRTGAPAFGNPLWLTLAVDYLNDLDMDDFVRADLEFTGTPEQRLLALLLDVAQRMPVALTDLYHWILVEAEARHGPAARAFTGLIALGRFGWRERDFHSLLPRLAGGTWSELQFSQLRRTFRAHLIEREGSGRWDFLHQSARQAVLADPRKFLTDCEEAHALISTHLESLPADDPLRQGELMYHYIQAGDRVRTAAHLVGVLLPNELEAAILALAGAVIDPNAGRGVDWVTSLLWTEGLDLGSRAVLARRLQDGLGRELARAGKTEAQAEVLEAVKDFWRSAAAGERLPGSGRYGWARTARELGELYRRLGRVEEAANAYVEGITVVLDLLKQPTPEPLRERPLAEVAPQAGWEVAEPQWRSADWLETLALCQCGFGDLLTAEGDFQEAYEVYNRLVWLDKLEDPKARQLVEAREPLRRQADYVLYNTRLGYVALLQGMGHWAITCLEIALSALDKFLALDCTNTGLIREKALLLGRMSQALRWEGAVRAATRTSGEAIRIMSDLVGKDPSNREWQVCLGYFHLWHGDAWQARGEQARAGAYYGRARALIARIAAADPDNEEWQTALAEVSARIGSSAEMARTTAEAEQASIALAEDEVWDYQKPQVITTSSEAARTQAMDPEELARWRRAVEPGPRFGDWRALLDKVEFVARERLESFGEEGVFEKTLELGNSDAKHGEVVLLNPLRVTPNPEGATGFTETLEQIRAAAELGDPQAQYKFGDVLLAGEIVERDVTEGIAWLRRAAEQDLVGAQYDLGVTLAHGDTPPYDPTEAVKWFTKAAEQGHPQAQYNLGVAYTRGRGVAADPAVASDWYRRAAEQGLAEAQFNLGVHYAEGFGVPQDYAEAARWCRHAAQQRLAPAQHNLGWLYLNGQGVERNEQAAVRWWTEAARQRNPLAQNDLGTYYAVLATPRDYGAAAKWYRRAAEQGLAEAQCSLGILCLLGKGVERSVEEAASWLNKAAAQGLVKAQTILDLLNTAATGQGVPPEVREQVARQPGGGDEIYRDLLDAIDQTARERMAAHGAPEVNEEGAARGDPQAQYRLAVHLSQRAVQPDFEAAARWYRKAADQGLAEAKYNLGYLYLQGQGVEQDTRAGLDWIRAAANQGLASAQYEFGVFYSEGRWVESDPETAALWYRRAAEQGLPQAQHNLAYLYLEGRGVPADRQAAMSWFKKAARQGFPPSQMALLMLEEMPFSGPPGQ